MNASTTIGLYDFLNMVVMGFIILFPIISSPNEFHFFVSCFIVGLIYHKLMENTLGICMRNKDCMILKAYESVNGKENEKDSSKENYYIAYYFLIKKGLLGNIPILEAQAAFLRNLLPIPIYYYCCCHYDKLSLISGKKDTMVFFAMFFVTYIIIMIMIMRFAGKIIKKVRNAIGRKFWKCFENVINGCKHFWHKIKNKLLKCLKYAKAFLFLLPILLSIVLTPCLFSKYKSIQFNCDKLYLVILITVFIIPYLWYQTQMKIHELVWEGKKYLEEDEQEKKNKINQTRIIFNIKIYNNENN